MQKIILKFKAPSNKELLNGYRENNHYFDGNIILPVEVDFIKDYEKNDYMNLVRNANNTEIHSVYYTRGLIHLDFTNLIIDVHYMNKLEKKGKKLVNHKNRDEYENDGLFITDPFYYLSEEKVKGYELTYPEFLMSPTRKVKKFIELFKRQEYYLLQKRNQVIMKIEEVLEMFDIRVLYNVKTEDLVEGEENHTIAEQGSVPLKKIVKNDWYYIAENISLNNMSAIYLQKKQIVFDFRQLKSELAFVNLLESPNDFKYLPSKPYLFRMIKEDPSEYVFLYYKDEYTLDMFERAFDYKKKVRLFMDEFKRNLRYFKIEDYKSASESRSAYNLAKEGLLKLNVKEKNQFSKRLNFFVQELLLPMSIGLFFLIILIYFLLNISGVV
jgi:hypothetical protein